MEVGVGWAVEREVVRGEAVKVVAVGAVTGVDLVGGLGVAMAAGLVEEGEGGVKEVAKEGGVRAEGLAVRVGDTAGAGLEVVGLVGVVAKEGVGATVVERGVGAGLGGAWVVVEGLVEVVVRVVETVVKGVTAVVVGWDGEMVGGMEVVEEMEDTVGAVGGRRRW